MTYVRLPTVCLTLAAALALGASARADTIITNEGERLQGEIKRVPQGWQVTKADGQVVVVPGTRIKSIELSSAPANGGRAMEGLQSLRRSVEHGGDIDKIIDRYQRFIEQSKDDAVDAEAKKDLQTWIDRRDRKMVKVGRRWMTRDEQREFTIKTLQQIEDTRQLLKTGKFREAEKIVAGLLETDPTNISALYLSGVLRSKEGNSAEAKKQFSALTQVVPDHPPTLLNLAVILIRQKQWGPAAATMEQALAAAPNVQFLLDSAAELMNQLPEDQQKTPVAQKLARRFAEQDAELQKAMSKRQMYRWGATWVDQPTHDKLLAVDVEVKKKLQDLQTDFDLTQNRISAIDQQVSDNEKSMREIAARSYVRTADGTMVRVPYPSAYYDMQREVTRLKGERQEMTARLDALRGAAKKVQAEYPVPKYTGVLRMIEEDGVPVVLPEDAPPLRAPGALPPPTPPATLPSPDGASLNPAPTTEPATPPIIRIGPGPDAE